MKQLEVGDTNLKNQLVDNFKSKIEKCSNEQLKLINQMLNNNVDYTQKLTQLVQDNQVDLFKG